MRKNEHNLFPNSVFGKSICSCNGPFSSVFKSSMVLNSFSAVDEVEPNMFQSGFEVDGLSILSVLALAVGVGDDLFVFVKNDRMSWNFCITAPINNK